MRILDIVRGIGRPARGRILAGLRDVIVSGRLCREPMGVCGADGCQAITPRAHISSLLDETDVPQRLPNASVEHILYPGLHTRLVGERVVWVGCLQEVIGRLL